MHGEAALPSLVETEMVLSLPRTNPSCHLSLKSLVSRCRLEVWRHLCITPSQFLQNPVLEASSKLCPVRCIFITLTLTLDLTMEMYEGLGLGLGLELGLGFGSGSCPHFLALTLGVHVAEATQRRLAPTSSL